VKPPLSAWFLVGCTAVGKTAVSQWLAEQMGAAILSTDAMLVYRGMDIGTAKPTPAERGGVHYLGIDLVEPDHPFSVGAWLDAIGRQFAQTGAGSEPAHAAGASSLPPDFIGPQAGPLIVSGGTGLYVKALLAGLQPAPSDPVHRARWQAVFDAEGVAGLRRALLARDPDALARLPDPDNPRRLVRALERSDAGAAGEASWKVQTPPMLVGLRLPRNQLHARIAGRVARMFRDGLADEVRRLRERFPAWSATAGQAIGYAETCAWLDGRLSQEEAMERTVIRTRQLAKRQETWYRHQLRVDWIDIDADTPPAAIAPRVLDAWRKHGPSPIRLS